MYGLTFNEEISDCTKTPIAIEVIQRGEKLSKYRANPGLEEAIPIIILLDGHRQIHKNTSPVCPLFDMSLIVGNGNIQGGKKYTVMIQINWNNGHLSTAENKTFMIKVSAPCDFSLREEQPQRRGW